MRLEDEIFVVVHLWCTGFQIVRVLAECVWLGNMCNESCSVHPAASPKLDRSECWSLSYFWI